MIFGCLLCRFLKAKLKSCFVSVVWCFIFRVSLRNKEKWIPNYILSALTFIIDWRISFGAKYHVFCWKRAKCLWCLPERNSIIFYRFLYITLFARIVYTLSHCLFDICRFILISTSRFHQSGFAWFMWYKIFLSRGVSAYISDNNRMLNFKAITFLKLQDLRNKIF